MGSDEGLINSHCDHMERMFIYPEVEDPCVRRRQALVGRHHLGKELRVDGQ